MFKPFLILTLSLTALSFNVGTAQASAPLKTGISYIDENQPIAFERVAASGSFFVHTWVRWNLVASDEQPTDWNPRDPGDSHYDWTWVDTWVRNARAAGLEPLLQIYNSPQWADRCPSSPRLPCNPNPKMMADFGYAAARRYSGTYNGLPRVRFWQPQNEPNLSLFFMPQFRNGQKRSPEIYRVLLNRFYEAVKSVHRNNKVISGGLAPNAVPGKAIAPLDFARRLLCMTGRKRPKPIRGRSCVVKMDGFDMHPYTSGGPTHRARGIDNIQISDLGKLKRLLAAADRAKRIKGDGKRTPLWVTEMSWDSNRPDPNGVRMGLLSRWTSHAVYQAWRAGVSNFFWYSLRDQHCGLGPGDPDCSETTQSGLYFRGIALDQDRPKPILNAFRFPFVAFPSARRQIYVWGRTPNSAPGRVIITRNGRRLGVVKTNASGVFHRRFHLSRGSNRRGAVQAIFSKRKSVPFSLRHLKDPPNVRPFG